MDLLWPPTGWLGTLLVTNALVGGAYFNYTWFVYLKRQRQPNLTISRNAISMYRRDTNRWSYFKLLLGSMTFGLPRIFAISALSFILALILT